jgi:sugar phosphate isomerase/epimerase
MAARRFCFPVHVQGAVMNDLKQSRRNVLLTGAAGVAASLLSRTALAADSEAASTDKRVDHGKAKTPSLKLSLSGYSFRDHLDKPNKPGKMSLFDLVDLCAELGLDGIEPTSYYFLKTDDEFVYALKRRIFLAGLVNTGMPIGDNFALPDGPEFNSELDKVKGWIDVAAKFGAPNMRIFAGRPNNAMSREQVFTQVVKGFKQASDYAGSKGVFLALENHGFMTETADDVIRIVEAVNHPWLAVNLDTGNFPKNPYDEVRKLAPYAVVAQFKTQVAAPGKPGNHEPADYPRLVQILRDAKYRGYVALEYEGPDPHKDVPVEIKKIKAALSA